MHTHKPCRLLRKMVFLDFGGGFVLLGFVFFFATAENGAWELSTRNVLLLDNTSQLGQGIRTRVSNWYVW